MAVAMGVHRSPELANWSTFGDGWEFFSCVCLMASMARSVNCLGQKKAVQVHLIGAKPIVQVKRWNERQDHSCGSLYEPNKNNFFLFERHLAQVAWSPSASNLICIPQSTHALDQGGVEPRQAVSLRPGGLGQYRFATASVLWTTQEQQHWWWMRRSYISLTAA